MRSSVDVHNFLVERDVPHELVSLKGRPRGPERVAAVLGLPPEQVGRVAVFESGDAWVAALVPADREADPRRVAKAAGRADLAEVSPERATDLTGFLAEATPPVGLPPEAIVVMDRRLSGQEVLYFPGGEATSVLKIRPADLAEAAGASVARLTR